MTSAIDLIHNQKIESRLPDNVLRVRDTSGGDIQISRSIKIQKRSFEAFSFSKGIYLVNATVMESVTKENYKPYLCDAALITFYSF